MGFGSGIRKKPIQDPDPGLGVKKELDRGSASESLDSTIQDIPDPSPNLTFKLGKGKMTNYKGTKSTVGT